MDTLGKIRGSSVRRPEAIVEISQKVCGNEFESNNIFEGVNLPRELILKRRFPRKMLESTPCTTPPFHLAQLTIKPMLGTHRLFIGLIKFVETERQNVSTL
jgi:hypothetical protein